MEILEIIAHKRDGLELTDQEIQFFIDGVTDNSLPDYQISALLMAIVINGMNERETVTLTKCMRDSGDTLDLSMFGDKTVDKHSTGGVGDKTTMIIAPIVASLGGIVAKMSGRGLGHTGGTIDKLESIPNFNTSLSTEEFIEQVKKIGVSVVGQTKDLAPADKKLYALRDITATVACVPLIASSVMSKKLAAGNHSILLDVKVGSGAFMKTIEDAKKLANQMVSIGKNCGKNVVALITNMDVPLGNKIGNALEVEEAIEVLNNKGPKDLRETCIALSSYMLMMSMGGTVDEWSQKVSEIISNGKAYQKFEQFVKEQHGDLAAFYSMNPAKYKEEILAENDGYICTMNAEMIGICAMDLGAGRKTLDDSIDPCAGIELHVKPGDFVCKGQKLATFFTNKSETINQAKSNFLNAITIEKISPVLEKHILDIIQ